MISSSAPSAPSPSIRMKSVSVGEEHWSMSSFRPRSRRCFHLSPMSSSSRRGPPPLPNQHPQYAAVPQSPRSGVPYAQSSALSPAQSLHRPSAHPSAPSDNLLNNTRSDTAQDVQTGAIGGAYGPYSVGDDFYTSDHLTHSYHPVPPWICSRKWFP